MRINDVTLDRRNMLKTLTHSDACLYAMCYKKLTRSRR